MDKMFEKLFGDFSVENFIKWLKDLINFYRSPYNTIEKISNQSASYIFSRFLFYFIFSNSFYFLANKSDNELQSNLNLALDGILGQFSILLSFIISSKIVTNKFNLKKSIIFLALVLFSFTPVQIIVYSNFIRFENYIFLYIARIILFVVTFFVVLSWSFAIVRNRTKAVLMLLINLLFLNAAQFLLYNVKIDPYSQPSTFNNNDPIYEDYKSVIKYIYSKEKIPTTYMYELGNPLDSITPITKRKLRVSVGTINGNDSKMSVDYETSEQYKHDISVNIQNLKSIDSAIVFRRNQRILVQWLNHFHNIENVINEHSTESYFKKNKNSFIHIFPGAYVSNEVYSKLIGDLINFEDYHNTVLKHHTNCKDIADLAPAIINIPATIIDHIFTDYSEKKQPLHYKFDELKDDDYRKYNTK
jgi:hypothetical protein